MRTIRLLVAAALAVLVLWLLAGCMPHCVVEGTMIATPAGEVPVEAVRVGDTVLSVNRDGRLSAGEVTGVRSAIRSTHLTITFADGQVLHVTNEHPIRLPDGRFVTAGSLGAGQPVSSVSGTTDVLSIGRVTRPARVYDLSVSPHETFIADGIVVHNKTVAQPATRQELNGTWIAIPGDSVIRLRIDPAGGWLTKGNTLLYKVEGLDTYTGWNGLDLTLIPQPPHQDTPHLRLHGKAYRNTIYWQTNGRQALVSGEFQMQREESVLEQISRSEYLMDHTAR